MLVDAVRLADLDALKPRGGKPFARIAPASVTASSSRSSSAERSRSSSFARSIPDVAHDAVVPREALSANEPGLRPVTRGSRE
jgi:hypothetical protein